MIRFLLTRGHAYTMASVRKSPLAPKIGLMSYDSLFRSRWLRRGTYVFSDLDRLSYWGLELAADLYREMKQAGLPVLNDPARFKNRYTLLRALHAAGLNDYNGYRVHEIGDIKRFPVFLRKIQGHRPPLSGLLGTQEEVVQAVKTAMAAGTPEENLVVIECVAEPVRADVYRKLAIFKIGDAIVPQVSVHDTTWLVKYGRTFDTIEDLYQEEQRLLEQNPFAAHFRKVFEVAGVDYGRADFGFYQGRIQTFEINTNPTMGAACPHPSATRVANMQQSWGKYMEALKAIDSAGGWPARLGNGRLQKNRPWKHLLVRTGKVH